MSNTPRRIFIVGNDRFDSIGDSYRRTLTPHYEVAMLNPAGVLPAWLMPWSKQRPTRHLATALGLASRVLTGDASGHVIPRLLRAVRDFAPDIILTTAIQSLNPKVIRALRAAANQVKIIGVFPDAISNFGRGYCFISDYDALFFKDWEIVNKVRTKLAWTHAYYLPQACDPLLHRPVELTDADRRAFGCDITLAGNMFAFRAAELEPLIGRSLRIWGNAVPRWLDHPIEKHCEPRYVAGDDKCKAMLAAKIVLNPNHYAEIAGTNKRTFEVAAIGAFQLTDAPRLADVFDPDTEVASFDSQSDMLAKIDHYLAHPEERARMANRAQQRAHREHTYAHRWAAKLEVLGWSLPRSFPVRLDQLAHRAQ